MTPAVSKARRRGVHKTGMLALVAGALLTTFGLLAGFGFMLVGLDAPAILMAAVPIGFVICFVGIVITLLGEPH